MNKHCLNCQKWLRKEDTIIGVCTAWSEFRFQYEECEKWVQGEERPPHRESVVSKEERNKLLDDEIERLIKEGKSFNAISGELKIGSDRIRACLKSRDLKPVFKYDRHKIKDEQLAEILAWHRQGRSNYWISKKIGVATNTIGRTLKRARQNEQVGA